MDGDGGGAPRRKLNEAEIGKRFDEMTDEDREWAKKVEAMSEADALKAISMRRFDRMVEESNRRDYEHFLGQIP